jgi:hypothetical protein
VYVYGVYSNSDVILLSLAGNKHHSGLVLFPKPRVVVLLDSHRGMGHETLIKEHCTAIFSKACDIFAAHGKDTAQQSGVGGGGEGASASTEKLRFVSPPGIEEQPWQSNVCGFAQWRLFRKAIAIIEDNGMNVDKMIDEMTAITFKMEDYSTLRSDAQKLCDQLTLAYGTKLRKEQLEKKKVCSSLMGWLKSSSTATHASSASSASAQASVHQRTKSSSSC